MYQKINGKKVPVSKGESTPKNPQKKNTYRRMMRKYTSAKKVRFYRQKMSERSTRMMLAKPNKK